MTLPSPPPSPVLEDFLWGGAAGDIDNAEDAVEAVEEAVEAYNGIVDRTGSNFAVVKAQIHAGGRGKGGGVRDSQDGARVVQRHEEV